METQILTVKYHDASGQPVAGLVSFSMNGVSGGAILGASSAPTDAQGIAQVTITGGAIGAFDVIATAPKANSVDWRTAVSSRLPPLQIFGTYHLDNTVDLGGGFPGAIGTAFRTIDDLTDSPNDPATWIIDWTLSQVSPAVAGAVAPFRGLIDPELIMFFLNQTPVVGQIREIGMEVSDVARHLGFGSELLVSPRSGVDGTAGVVERHTLKSVVYTINNVRHEYMLMNDLNIREPVAMDILGGVQNNTTLLIGKHQFDVAYGNLLLVALDRVILPHITPGATNLGSFLNANIDCARVAQSIAGHVPAIPASVWQVACVAGLNAAGQIVENQLQNIQGTGGRLDWQGQATMVDKDGNQVVDALVDGRWIGTFTVTTATSNLGLSPLNAFTGQRIAF
jgi:hypothetical protein